MELQQLKYFKAVAENGKISDTANSLYISPPALSTAIQRLEKDVGCKLFDRTKNSITLNQQGKIFLKHVNRVFEEIDLAYKEVEESISAQTSTVSLMGINALMWSGLMAEFAAANPDISISFTMIPISSLSRHGLSTPNTFLLASDSDLPEGMNEVLDSVFLLENTPMVMVSPYHPLANEDEIDVSMLKGENIIMTTPDHSMYREIERLFGLHNIPIPTKSLDSNQMRQLLVEKNLGISFVSKYAAKFMPSSLRFIPLRGVKPWITRLYWIKEQKLTKSEELFKCFAEEFFAV